MRLKLELIPLENSSYDNISFYNVQGFIYKFLKNTAYYVLHDRKTYKYFNFSNIFPIEPFEIGKKYFLIVSSPYKPFINELYKEIKKFKDNVVKIGDIYFLLNRVKKFDIKLKFPWQTATPIVLKKSKEVYIHSRGKIYKTYVKNLVDIKKYVIKKVNIKKLIKKDQPEIIDIKKLKKLKNPIIIYVRDIYYSFEKKDSLVNWLSDLKQNSVEKFRKFSDKNEDFTLEENLFDELEFRKEVSIKVKIKGKDITFIGTLWKKLTVLRRLDKEERTFYKFLMDCGLGIHNSLGFGFINPVLE